MLLRDSFRSSSTLPISLDPFEIPKQCFLLHPSSQDKIINIFFQKELVTTQYVVTYWKIVVEHIDINKVLTKPSKYIITNKVREISFKSLLRFYPANTILPIDTSG